MRLAKKKHADLTKLWEAYFDAFKKHDWQKALAALNALREAAPSDPNVFLKIGDIEQRTGRAAEAISAYHKSAWHLIKAGFQQKALAIYKLILRIDPNNEEALKMTGELLMQIESAKEGTSGLDYTPSAPVEEPTYEQAFGLAEMPTESADAPSGEETSVAFPSYEGGSILEGTPPASWEPSAGETTEENVSAESEGDLEDKGFVVPSVFASLPKEDAASIIERGELRTYEAGDMVLEEGDTGDSMFVIKKGSAKVIAHILGKTIELASLGEGDVFGEVAFLTGRPRTASVIAQSPLDAIEIDKLALEDAIEKNPRVLEKLQDFFYSRVQDTIKKVKGREVNR